MAIRSPTPFTCLSSSVSGYVSLAIFSIRRSYSLMRSFSDSTSCISGSKASRNPALNPLVVSGHPHDSSSNGREGSHRGRLLRKKCGAHALSQVSSPAFVYWLGCDRSRMQDGDRFTTETVRNVLDRAGSQRDLGLALLPSQRPL